MPFAVRQKQFHRAGTNDAVAYLRYIEINVFGNQYRLLRSDDYSSPFTFNGISYKIPYSDEANGINIVISGGSLVFSTNFGLTVQWNNKDYATFHVTLCDAYANHVCGLCGNGDG